jgi:prepilin-type N-terminal cleavage/methylation domain-containing protein
LIGGFLRHALRQDGFTLVEVVISSAIGAMLMAGLTSVLLSSVTATNVATSRIEASSQLRSFQFFAGDDFARSDLPSSDGCTETSPCTQPIVLLGITRDSAPIQVTYRWNKPHAVLDRQVGPSNHHVATGVRDFFWYVDGSPPKQTVVINMKVTVQDYSEFQALRFYPRLQW